MARGLVYLVGAGPGAPGLLTVKGRRVLETVDAIVYDRLASPRLLGYAKPDVELHYVGKEAGDHAMSQQDIEQLLISLARAGRIVARLKGGDPFVFGRGGEEAAALTEAGIPFEVVPGITSAVGVPAYAGIPVTYRKLSPSFTVVAGHRMTSEDEVDWHAYAQLSSTLVILMGVRQLHKIVDGLRGAGLSGETPVALIRWGTRAAQRTLVGSLEDIVSKVAAAKFESPAIIVVGDVVSKRSDLSWFESLPLAGRRIFVTAGTTDEVMRMAEAVESLGAETFALSAEMLAVQGDGVHTRLRTMLAASSAGMYFTTTLGVKIWFSQLKNLGVDVRQMTNLRIAADSLAVARHLEQYGVFADGIGPCVWSDSTVRPWFVEASPGVEGQSLPHLSQEVHLYSLDLTRSWLDVARMWLEDGVDAVWSTSRPSWGTSLFSLDDFWTDKAVHAFESAGAEDDWDVCAQMQKTFWREDVADAVVVRG
ncbi:uroporphyrinogen-III C-methyltransferase [Alicyclobacillus suci]|uniref:uroporphyrinogen-III C-methyltransferase n=1 Tax=Alicyclobacillus suci TaxID=2816080 RepID=UPI001A8F0215|nr:uroporphyrinogen-III C-methyltransferase [Alicyclobacillus suci]